MACRLQYRTDERSRSAGVAQKLMASAGASIVTASQSTDSRFMSVGDMLRST